ncbi:MAG: hypothetical protein JEZ08_02625 [Clostridiales bacterium]|nr:hypothetical protein [Clostridiales bacterium]
MKKNAITYTMIFIFICTTVIVIKNNYSLKEEISSSNREVAELQSVISINDGIVDKTYEQLNQHIDDYEYLINRWIDYDMNHNYRMELAQKSYDVEAIVHTAKGSFPLPKNGNILVDSDFVEIEINIVKPPIFINDEINEIIHFYDNAFDDLTYDSYDSVAEYFIDDDTIRLKYSNLEYGDSVDMFINGDLFYLLDLIDTNIQINVTNEIPISKDYLPINVKKKVFDDENGNLSFTHNFEYVSDNSWILDLGDSHFDFVLYSVYKDTEKIKYEYSDGVKATAISRSRDIFTSFDETVLPNALELGESWNYGSFTAMITAIDYPIETTFGIFDTVEVTYKDESGILLYRYYYAKELGLVHKNFLSLETDLIEVEYFK